MRRLQGGLTIVETMIVITVIGILAGIIVVSAGGMRVTANDNQRQLNAETIASKLELYYRKNTSVAGSTYPTTSTMTHDAKNIVDNSMTLESPNHAGNSIAVATATTPPPISDVRDGKYIYQPFSQTGTLCTSEPCVRFVLYYYRASDESLQKIDSMRQQ